ncbi:MAG TPA: prolyl oligopeptidase family serine peptidase [Gemmatimonadaceae bacterium]|nr:prolyl oligopeptidase family serine peptidase [Gemmatimonadaceae bacterium]
MMLVRHFPRAAVSAVVALFMFVATPIAAQRSGGDESERAAAQATTDRAELVAREEAEARYIQPPAPIADFFRRDANFAILDAPSPDGRHFLVPLATQLSTLELMSRPTYRLAELEIRPATDRLWHLDTYGIYGLRIFDLAAQRYREVKLPPKSFLSDMVWSSDGKRVAFLAHLPGGTQVWTADAASGNAKRFSDARILATLGTEAQVNISPEVDMRPSRMLQWTSEGTILTLMVPVKRGAEPERDRIPDGPLVRLTRPEKTTTRTFSNLLRDSHDADLFDYYTRSQLVELAPGKAPRAIGEPRMYESISLSPDGRYILATYIERPFSFITSYRGFPRRTVVLDRSGKLLATIESRELREGGGRPDSDRDRSPREIAWRPDSAGLSYLQRDSAGTDLIMLLSAPFDTGRAKVVATSRDPIRGVAYTRDGSRAFASVSSRSRRAIAQWALGDSPAERRLLSGFHHTDSILTDPGQIWRQRTGNGIEYVLTSSAGDAVYLRGDGLAADFRPQPFVDRVSLADTAHTRIFQGPKSSWDRPLVALDPDLKQMIVSRESVTLFPDSYLWTRGSELVNLTHNKNPFPELASAKHVDFSFTRQDGLEVQGRVTLPPGYREGEKVPAIFWTYPREFTTPDDYTRSAIENRNHNAFTHLTWLRWSELWLTQGYAIVYPDIPIVGENYNDTYISNMVDAMYGAMRAVDKLGVIDMDRIGHGGHSYGAFATANLLAHTPFFKAGIAGDGAYNRSLTPTGFQAERRDIWSAPATYIEMSPFFSADQIDAPLLMYHGAADNNTGTWPIQSERLIHALTSLGKTAALYEYPFESHTPRAIENNLDMWARWIGWFDRYVKGTGSGKETTAGAGR